MPITNQFLLFNTKPYLIGLVKQYSMRTLLQARHPLLLLLVLSNTVLMRAQEFWEMKPTDRKVSHS